MVYYFPVLGAVMLAAGTILERLVLKKKTIGIRSYQVASFLAIVIAISPFLYFFWKLDARALELGNILIFLAVILFALFANLLVFYSLKWEKVTNLEPARVLEPLFVILLVIAFSFFIDSVYARNPKVILPAIVASLALVFSHVEKHNFKFNKYFIAAILGSFFFALELVISRLILDLYSPVSFYFFRSASILILSFLIFRPSFKELDRQTKGIVFATGIIWAIYRIIIYYGYLNIGIVFTTLILMLGPIFIYFFAHFFLKEKMSWRNFVAAIIIVGSIIYALV